MNSFPKKYKIQDLRNRAKIYREKQNKSNWQSGISPSFFVNILPISKKLSYDRFFPIYMGDFFSYKKTIENWYKNSATQQLFVTYWDQVQNTSLSHEFFSKKNQTLSQVWGNKLERYILSQNKKNFNTNKKILDSYLSSPHKIYIPDSDLYLYILNKFHELRDVSKIIKKTQIWYRSFNLQTSILTQNIIWKEEKIPCYTLKYFVWAKCEALPVCVEDIDLCCWDVALLVHPKDKRYNKYIWKNAIIPLCNRQIPIIWDENVNIAVDNWIKRVCPCCDNESIDLAKKYWLPTDIYVFDKQWLYTQYIHEPAFIWQERDKYYNNIVWFIEDIWNLAQKWEKLVRIPYLNYTKERLIPYKLDQFVIDVKEEKQKILNQIFEWSLSFSFLEKDFEETFKEIANTQNELNNINTDEPILNEEDNTKETDNENTNKKHELETKINQLKQQIIDEVITYLPDTIICNSQLPYWRKLPILKEKDSDFSFFDIEKDCQSRKEKPLQLCFNFVLLSLIREWTVKNKAYEFDKFVSAISQNEKKIQYFLQDLSKIIWEKPEHEEFLNIIKNLTDEVSPSINDFSKLIKNCKHINQEWNQIIINIEWLYNDVFDPEFVHLCIPCYLHSNIHIEDHMIINEDERNLAFQEVLIQELLLWKVIFHKFTEFSCKSYEFLWDKQLNKTQMEQAQRDSFLTFWENPIRLNFLINETYDQKEVLLNSIFLKQIRNAVRLCLQKDFLPKNIEECLNNEPETLDGFDTSVLYKLEELYNERHGIKTYEQYKIFFENLKTTIQNVFFSWYLEIQKIHSTENVQFVCAYFFNFLFSVMYPLTPEFIDALQYVSQKDFLLPVKPLKSWKAIDYTMNILFRTFSEVKNLKLESNIKQHESCKMFIKSNPSILDMFSEHEQIFKNYFHITEITYLRLHESSPLWYETFSDETLTIWLQPESTSVQSKKDSIENIERDIKNLDDKLNLLRQRIQILPEWQQRQQAEEEYAKTKEEMETLTIKHSLLSSK